MLKNTKQRRDTGVLVVLSDTGRKREGEREREDATSRNMPHAVDLIGLQGSN